MGIKEHTVDSIVLQAVTFRLVLDDLETIDIAHHLHAGQDSKLIDCTMKWSARGVPQEISKAGGDAELA
ncbi:hypothetical protein CFC21_066341 [Triticum aestivum]|uniref:Uncharacterized protein n=3 Tax=Triticum TaxID=4564 RepID=A0A341UVR1_WHEAT|nr:hypothetical protein TRIUR3_27016 [Triticum urartu]KAF7059418.1 hypothetical protein CFC21_066327 [Triticum aestivum]KAF7059421.1 hypothetical protein CFC21_066330 [Triticum aestivum]KAF7059424.1 hypothetical protein CFC21_066333 [Triticum aestivum]KAF7059431.1 hypothetical protein CFC21_066339 [Triticum aestivum]